MPAPAPVPPEWPATCCGWLLRHGETDGNAAGLVQGQGGGTGLSVRGRAQVQTATAAALRSRLRPAAILSSDLPRCRETAAGLAAGLRLPISWSTELRERSFGALEGRAWSDVGTVAVGIDGDRVTGPGLAPPGGESVTALRDRVLHGLRRAAALPGPVLLVTHGGPIRVALGARELQGMPWPAVPHARPLPICLRAHRVGGAGRPGQSGPYRAAGAPVVTAQYRSR